ncbi:MAG: hypothetical protein K2P35_14740, partial [Lachnospiraceae bacterium]|nr:hypothetical protein [Lachnospiraceae bacterium]
LWSTLYLDCTPKKGGKGVGIHKGTKLTDVPKNHSLKFRYDDETAKKLDFLVEKHHVSKADVIRKGIEIQFNEEKE